MRCGQSKRTAAALLAGALTLTGCTQQQESDPDAAARPATPAASPTPASSPQAGESQPAASPAGSPTASAEPAGAEVPAEAMLAPELVEGFSRASMRTGLERPLLDPCGGTHWPSSSERTAGRTQVLNGPQRATITQQLFTYTSEQAAAEAAAEFARAVRGCPERSDGQGGRVTYEVQPNPRVGADGLLVRVATERNGVEPQVRMVHVFRRSHGVTLLETAGGTGSSSDSRYQHAVEVSRAAVGQLCHLTACD